MSYIKVVEDESDDSVELPTEADDTLLVSTLSAQFSGACGLKYRATESGSLRGLKVVDGKIFAPPDGWNDYTYICVFPKENTKRKIEEQCDASGASKLKRIEAMKKKCTDLIVLGLPFKTTEDELKEYFEQFGEVLVSQIKKDSSGKSRGFGFIRFADYDSQLKVLSQRHQIEGRWCDVKIPDSKGGSEMTNTVLNRKVFVGRITDSTTNDDLKDFFSKYGEVVDVFIPKPFRAFAFVTFADPEVAQNLCGEDFVIKGTSVHISAATPKHQQDGHLNDLKNSWDDAGSYQSGYGSGNNYYSSRPPASGGRSGRDGARSGYGYSPYGDPTGRAAGPYPPKQPPRSSPWLRDGAYDGPPMGYGQNSMMMGGGPPPNAVGPVPPPSVGPSTTSNLATGTNQATLGMGALNINPLLSAVVGIQALLSAQAHNSPDVAALLNNLQASNLQGGWGPGGPHGPPTTSGALTMSSTSSLTGGPPSMVAAPSSMSGPAGGPPAPRTSAAGWGGI